MRNVMNGEGEHLYTLLYNYSTLSIC